MKKQLLKRTTLQSWESSYLKSLQLFTLSSGIPSPFDLKLMTERKKGIRPCIRKTSEHNIIANFKYQEKWISVCLSTLSSRPKGTGMMRSNFLFYFWYFIWEIPWLEISFIVLLPFFSYKKNLLFFYLF